MIDGLKEIEMEEKEDLSFLSDEYKVILRDAEKIRKEFKS